MVLEKILEIIAEKLGCDPSEISPEATFEALGIDSLDATELAMDVEEALGVEIAMDKDIVKVSDFVAKVEALLSEK